MWLNSDNACPGRVGAVIRCHRDGSEPGEGRFMSGKTRLLLITIVIASESLSTRPVEDGSDKG